MGGVETRNITLARPETFGYYGVLSGGTYAPQEIKSKDLVRMVFMSCGSKENPESVHANGSAVSLTGIVTVQVTS